jgi:hypothetical protein
MNYERPNGVAQTSIEKEIARFLRKKKWGKHLWHKK